ncbi:MAG TPA: hypothetical protein VN176_01620 [Verrucomicrobiae bacterium]|jgi:hypothetical protein|nr:hypothetical protein [Verrucomicrobiae bacterium]
MHANRLKAAAALLLSVFFTSCSDSPKVAGPAAKESQAASEPISGKTAFWEMYKSAHSWAADRVPLKLESKSVPGVTIGEGKAAMWSATFGSPRLRQARVFSYSVIASKPDIYKGVVIGKALPWAGPTSEALAFEPSEFPIDSDAAYKTGSAQAAVWLKSHPDREVSFVLGNASRFTGPVWYVQWGDKKSGYGVLVDAKTGAVVKH